MIVNSQKDKTWMIEDEPISSNGSSEIMSLNEQIVRFSANASTLPDVKHSDVEFKESSLVVRLEQELNQAQICNHRLNQQLKILANSSDKVIKLELSEAKKQAKDRLNEVEQLKKRNNQLIKEREMWLTKQPQEVTALLAEKQELRKQLDREQSEKQELFLQINSMIAKLADSGDQDEINKLKNDLKTMQRALDLEKQSSSSEVSRLKAEIVSLKGNIQNSLNESDKDKESMELEIENLNRQLNIKTASLQSLMLAKSDSGAIESLRDENDLLKRRLDDSEKLILAVNKEVAEKKSELEKLKDMVSMSEVSKNSLEALEEKLANISKLLKEEQQQKSQLYSQTEQLKVALSSSESTLSNLRDKLSQFEESAEYLKSENSRLKEYQRDATLSDSARIKEMSQMLTEERDNNAILSVQLREKDGKIDRLQVDLLSALSRAQQAEEDAMKRKENYSVNAVADSENSSALKDELSKTKQKLQSLDDKMTECNRVISEKDYYLKRLEGEIVDSKKQLKDASSALEKSEEAHRERQKTMKNQTSDLESALESMKKQYSELLENQKANESKSLVADEITTLMSSLSSLRQDNAQYEEDSRSLQNDIRALREELYEQQDKRMYWQESAEKTASDLESQKKLTNELELLRKSEMKKLEDENSNLEAAVDKSLKECENAKREASDAVSKMKREMMEFKISFDRETQSLREKSESMARELESSRKTIDRMQDEHCKLIGMQDEGKQALLTDLHAANDTIEKMRAEVEKLKPTITSLESELQQSEENANSLKIKLSASEDKVEDTMKQLQIAEELADRLQEAQILSSNVESNFADFKSENETRMEKVLEEHKLTVKNLQDELERSQRECTSLESVLEDQQKECKVLQEQLREKREQADFDLIKKQSEETARNQEKELIDIRSQSADFQQKIEELERRVSELNLANRESLDRAEKLTALLENVSSEKEFAEQEVNKLKQHLNVGKNELNEANSENTRLASELLKFHSAAETSLQEERDRVSKQFEDRLKSANLEKTRLASELQVNEAKRSALESETRELQSNLENAEKRRRIDIQQLDYLREELHQVKNGAETLKASGPIAPPRSSTRTISNMSAMTNWTQADFSDCEDLTRLRSEIDKQKRLIIVLRRKLQGLQQ